MRTAGSGGLRAKGRISLGFKAGCAPVGREPSRETAAASTTLPYWDTSGVGLAYAKAYAIALR